MTMSYRYVRSNNVCIKCVNDDFLRKKIIDKSYPNYTCHYCHSVDQCTVLGYLAVIIEKAINDHYEVENDPTREDRRYPPKGIELFEVIQKEIKPESDQLAEDLCQAIFEIWERYSEEAEAPSPDDTFINVGVSEYAISRRWSEMHESLRKHSRFLNAEANEVLKMIFDNVTEDYTKDGKSLITEAGPAHELKHIYRARVFQNDDSLTDALINPEAQLGPPGSELAASGRMNAKGISVFYGATIPEIALSEVRPPVGSKVVVAKFEFIRNLRLLDLTKFKDIDPVLERSMFDESTLNKAIRRKFIARLERELVKPVMPNNSDDGYLVTQVVADFLASHQELNLDGVIFTSIQVSPNYKKVPLNVVLFNKASYVDPSFQRGGLQIAVNLVDWDDKGNEFFAPEAWVSKERGIDNDFWEVDDSVTYSLKLIPESIVINEITGVSFTCIEHELKISELDDLFEAI